MTRYAFALADGECVTGAVLAKDGKFLPRGRSGHIRADLVHAELGLSLTTCAEPEPGHVMLVDPERDLARVVPLAGAAVEEVLP